MKYLKIGLATVLTAWFVFVGGFFFWNFAPADNFLGVTTRASAAKSNYLAGSIGDSRHTMLVEATRAYTEKNADVPQDIADGKAFAPAQFLNSELKRKGARWRVRKVDGLDVEIVEIS